MEAPRPDPDGHGASDRGGRGALCGILSGLCALEGRIRPNPYIAIANQQMREIKSFAAEFGLTPSTRAAMIANVVSAAKAKVDPMEAILVSDMDTEFEVVGGSNFEEEDS